MKHSFKITLSIVVLIGLIFAFGIYSLHTLTTSSNKIIHQIDAVEAHTKSGNWDQARASLTSVKQDWESTSKTWTVLLDHIEIDNIDTSLARMEKFIDTKDASQALAESATLRQYVGHIPEIESVKLKNIF